jgi:hypothetical protein
MSYLISSAQEGTTQEVVGHEKYLAEDASHLWLAKAQV